MDAKAFTWAREFISHLQLLDPPPTYLSMSKDVVDYDAAKQQAAVVGSDVIAFVKGVTPERRNDIVNASLLAQLVAKKLVAVPNSLAAVNAWYDEYFDVLSRIGFLIEDKGFADYNETSNKFEAHEAVLEVAAALLAGAPGALALVKATLGALQKMSADSPWITLFNRESQSANTARFQVSLVDEDDNGRLMVALMAFGLHARTTLTQVLFSSSTPTT